MAEKINLTRAQLELAVGPSHQIIREFEKLFGMVDQIDIEFLDFLLLLIRSIPPGGSDLTSGDIPLGSTGTPGRDGADGAPGMGVPGMPGADGQPGAMLGAGSSALREEYVIPWTPSLGGNETYNSRSGILSRIGRFCLIKVTLDINTIGTGSTSVIDGLPYFATYATGITVVVFANLALSPDMLGGFVSGNTITMNGTLAPSASITSPLAVFGNGSQINLSAVYLAD